jgi:2-polyprenyl-3-methyl-5-hydroxy-6-metoxy-1,4-benzoquinol methylase
MKDYRERFYNSYATNASSNEYSWTVEEYELLARVNSIRYRDLLPVDKGARSLDIACGAGHFLYFLQKKAGFRNAEGVDISPEQIRIAKEAGITNLYLGDSLERLRDNPGCYDLITAHHFIEHLTKDEVLDFLEAARAALRTGGRLILTTGNVASLFGATHICSDFTHEGGFTPRSFHQLLKTFGFRDIEVRGIGPVPYDLKGRVRVALWRAMRKALVFYLTVERGRSRAIEKGDYVLELDMLGTGVK